MQYVIGSTKRSHYLGPDNATLRGLVKKARQLSSRDEASKAERQREVATGVAAGLNAPSPAEARVFEALVQSGLFEAGAVLVGSHAFLNIGNMLCVTWDGEAGRTLDIDIAINLSIEVAAPDREMDLADILRGADRGFFPVPALDPTHSATRFKIRNREITVSILAPELGKPASRPILIPGLNAAAEPVRFLDYVLEESQPAVIPSGAGLLIRVPDPARFALHKLVVSQRRPSAMAAKSRKDIHQAAAVLEVLKDLRPGDIAHAWEAAQAIGGQFVKQLKAGTGLLYSGLRDFIKQVI